MSDERLFLDTVFIQFLVCFDTSACRKKVFFGLDFYSHKIVLKGFYRHFQLGEVQSVVGARQCRAPTRVTQ